MVTVIHEHIQMKLTNAIYYVNPGFWSNKLVNHVNQIIKVKQYVGHEAGVKILGLYNIDLVLIRYPLFNPALVWWLPMQRVSLMMKLF